LQLIFLNTSDVNRYDVERKISFFVFMQKEKKGFEINIVL